MGGGRWTVEREKLLAGRSKKYTRLAPFIGPGGGDIGVGSGEVGISESVTSGEVGRSDRDGMRAGSRALGTQRYCHEERQTGQQPNGLSM